MVASLLSWLWPGDWGLRYSEPHLILLPFPRAEIPKLLPKMQSPGLPEGVSEPSPRSLWSPGGRSQNWGPRPWLNLWVDSTAAGSCRCTPSSPFCRVPNNPLKQGSGRQRRAGSECTPARTAGSLPKPPAPGNSPNTWSSLLPSSGRPVSSSSPHVHQVVQLTPSPR